MATYNMTKSDVDEHKRKIYIQNLARETTKRSLNTHFSKYGIDWCAVPTDESGKNKRHGIVMFSNKESVDTMMSERPHIIDGKEVFVHRAIPEQRSAKDNLEIQQLIVAGPTNHSLIQSDIQKYFSQYGRICNISKVEHGNNTWTIDFDDYDIVDRIILDSPHCIEQIDVSVEKGTRNILQRRPSTPGPLPNSPNNNNPAVIPKKSNLKQVTMNEQIACLTLPARKYRIHITNLPMNMDAETLSDQFDWDFYDIVIDPSAGNQASSGQCWLKNPTSETEVDNFVQRWNGKRLKGSVIQCEKEEDEFELCNKFQYGQCAKTGDDCHWEHVECTAQGTCSSTCSYGHKAGMKSKVDSSRSTVTTSHGYRIKLTGFKREVTPQYLSQQLALNNCYVDPKHVHIGYVVNIKTMKYAKQLMTKWHNTSIDRQNIKCQLELNPILSAHHSRARSPAKSLDGERKRSRSRSRPRDVCSLRSNQETAELGETDNTMSISFDNREVDRDRRICGKALNDVTRSLSKPNLRRESSSEGLATANDTKYPLPSDLPRDEWEITKKASDSTDGKVLLIRNKVDRKRLAVIKIYPNQRPDDFYREITVMKDLKGIKGVSQLIEPENGSNNLGQRRGNNDNLWMIMERAPGYSLKEFIERKYQGTLDISTVTQLILKLIEILQHTHNKGIFHQNLSPENIMIEWETKSSINDAQLTILNFNQAVSVTNRKYTPVTSSTQKWYHAPQVNDNGLVSTVDPSGSCAVLFWLLTKINPRHENKVLPHQQANVELDNIIKSAVRSTNTSRSVFLEEELKRYLKDTFDRAFGFPYYHPWTIHDLKCRLESILQLLKPVEFKMNTIDTIFQELISISDSIPATAMVVNHPLRDVFETASKVFCRAKKHFLEIRPNQYEWSDGGCTWIYNPHSSINECHHDDILTYHSFSKKMTTSYSVIITCLASCIEEERVVTLSISTNINGKTIQMPIGQY